MAFRYGWFSIENDVGEANSGTAGSASFGQFDYIAVGLFTGDQGLPPERTRLESVAEWESYLEDMTAKTTEIEDFGHVISIQGPTIRYAFFGSTANDSFEATDVSEGGFAWLRDGNDRFFAGRSADTIHGGLGRDRIAAGGGADRLLGEGGNDLLRGGGGHDLLIGGAGSDTMYGGLGADTFSFTDAAGSEAADWVRDFRDEDLIDVSRIDADVTLAGDQAFVMVEAFSGQAGELVVAYDAGSQTTSVLGDIDGDALEDFLVSVEGFGSVADNIVL
jgi:Ca2+-binding RTX toxin-like protein